jgi:hypothetical protein
MKPRMREKSRSGKRIGSGNDNKSEITDGGVNSAKYII